MNHGRRYLLSLVQNRSICTSCIHKTNRRVVVTGLGVLSPLGVGVQQSWNRLIDAQSGIVNVNNEDRYKDIPCKVAGYVPEVEKHLEKAFSKSQLRTLSRATLYVLLAAREAMNDAGLIRLESVEEASRFGVAIGSGMVDFDDVCSSWDTLHNEGYNRLSPHFITRVLPNMPAGHVSMEFGLRGINHTVSTACTTGTHSIGDAFNFIRHNVADVMICGGVETPINPLSLASFSRIRALCTKYNEQPTAASRPFDQNRCGFVMGEGAALMVIEELDHAQQRNAKIYGEILGYGLSADANHVTAPRENGEGAKSCMLNAIRDANLQPEQVGHINCHATSTPLGDQIELNAINDLFGEHCNNLTITSTKGSSGHLLGAAGAIEAMFTLLSCHYGILPPTLNLDTPPETNVNIVGKQFQHWNNNHRIALSNSFGFGGTNASIIICNYF